jgi:hypothetical protein
MPQGDGHNGELAENLLEMVKENKELLASAALSAAGAAVVSKGPQLVRKLTHATEERGEEEAERMGQKAMEGAKEKMGGSGLGGKALSKMFGGGGDNNGGGGGSGGKKTRRLPIQRWTDVAVPVEKAYQAWTKFDEYPQFMHRVLNVERKDRDKISWQEKIWFSSREWEGEITERRKNDRIAWKTTSGMSHRGIVSFHKIGDNLTRVMVDMEFEPNGMIEKMASGMRFVKRAVQSDLARFKAYVEMEDARGIEYRPNDDADEPTTRGRKSDGERKSDREQRAADRKNRRSSTRS